jgi:acetoin utilization deacetylase AcuC-like enzyme
MLKAASSLGVIFFPAFDWAISPTHPEREARLLYTQDQFREEGLFDIDGIDEYRPLYATNEDIMRAHFCFPSVEAICTESHRISAGGAIQAARLVLEQETRRAFALVRPPGHHAMKVVHGNRGFCNINIEAVMIEWIREHYGRKKIAIVDTDCHHGDGTQDVYWHDPDVLFISLHQDGRTLYPGAGFPYENGGPRALGKTINIPLPPRTSDEGFLYTLENAILPILDDFQPELVINSAGQDNHYSDPITNMRFSARGYALLNDRLSPDIAVLEGGYSIEKALPYVNTGIILAMAGLDYDSVREPDYHAESLRQSDELTRKIERDVMEIRQLWKNRHSLKKKMVGDARYTRRRKGIYYDTDGISEHQEETVRICEDCGGLVLIDSQADTGKRIYAVIIPRHACPACRREGEDFFGKIPVQQYSHIYLQDRDRDNFQVKSR